MSNASVGYDARHPCILPDRSHFAKLVIKQYHQQAGHSGLMHTMNLLKGKYWVLKGSSAVRKVIDDCVVCRRENAVSGKQLMADILSSRLQVSLPPFFHTGVDYYGPFSVKQGRSSVKRYGCIFTCMTTRAVYLELAYSLSTDSFISAQRRFVGRRGCVRHIYSDNSTNFVGADKELRKALEDSNQHRIAVCLQQKEIDWHFNTPTASHFGGVWERLIRSVRKVLGSIAGQAVFTDESLSTLLVEMENVLNSRPLTPVSFVDGSHKPLTPNDLLMVCPGSGLPLHGHRDLTRIS